MEGLCYGQLDVDLSENHESEFKIISDVYSDLIKSSVIYTSPLKRCMMLAAWISEGRSYRVEPRIQELNFGKWEGRFWKDIPEEESSSWTQDFLNTPTPEGESYMQMKDRIILFLNELIDENPGDAVLVTHAGVIRVLLGYILEIPPANIFSLQVDTGRMSSISFENGNFNIEFMNR